MVGEQSGVWGQEPVAYLTLKEPITLPELIAYLTHSLLGTKHPVAIIQVKEMPRTASGK